MKQTKPALWIIKRIKKRIPALALMTATHILTALLGVLFALGTRWIIDSAQAGDTQSFQNACIAQGLLIVGILTTLTLDRHLREKLAAQMDRDWKQYFFHRLLGGEYAKVARYHTGELINRLNNDVRIVNGGALSLLPSVASMLTKLVAAMAFLITLAPELAFLVMAGGVVIMLATGFLRRKLKTLHKQVAVAEGKVSGFLQETLEKLLFVQAMDISDEVERRSDILLGNRYALQRKRKNISVMSSTCLNILSYGAAFGALVWCSGGLLAGTITFGTLTAVSQLVGQLQGPFVNLSSIMPQYIAMTAAAERLMELDEVGERPQPREDAKDIYACAQGFSAEKITFGYDRDRVFENADFFLPKDSFGVVVGQSGIGKSTLLKLLLGVFSPESGKLYMKTPTEDVPVDATTRSLFAYVPQGNLLLSGTIRQNLLLTRPDATQAELEQAIYVSAMDGFLHTLPDGLDTMLGENAAGLSEGQAQRLSIARAVLSQAPVLLLDEATSALDSQTEQTVLSRLREIPGKTCIAVTHRAAPVESCDWVLQVEDGKCTIQYK